jgi:dynein heavy chain
MLEGLYTEENKFKDCHDKMQYELFFCFAAVWAFGGAYAVKDGEDHRMKFNRWWRNEWRPVKFPDQGTVFDYFADQESLRYAPWADVTKAIEYDTSTAMSSVTVPTTETTGLSFWIDSMMQRRRPCILVGYSGSGKTAIINGVLQSLDPDSCISLTINFNYFTDSAMLQKVMEGPLEKKAGKNYGPPGTKRLIYFVDDLNMPQVDPYNTQTPIALLRQHFDYEHWFDREKLTQKNIGNCQYLSCMNPAAGSFSINPRLQRHFLTYAIGMPSQDSLLTIYSTFLSAHLKDFEANVFERTTKLIGAGLELHGRVVAAFRKTAVKFHYEFNVRHLSNMFQGILMAQKECIKEPWRLVKLWIHEAERTYGDLLLDLDDLAAYQKISKEVTKKYFPNDPEKDVFPDPNIFVHFANGLQEQSYGDIPSYEVLSGLLEEGLKEYNEMFAAMDLVLFEDAMRHVCRITRIVENGHALLVGVGGSGKQSLSRLGSFIAQSTVQTITIHRTYSVSDLKADIMAMYTKAGAKGEKLTWIFTDSQVTDEKFLVFINDLLASGDIPDLFPPDDKENMINAVRGEVKSAGIVDTNENCMKHLCSNEFKAPEHTR